MNFVTSPAMSKVVALQMMREARAEGHPRSERPSRAARRAEPRAARDAAPVTVRRHRFAQALHLAH